jgi:hypothetical protein
MEARRMDAATAAGRSVSPRRTFSLIAAILPEALTGTGAWCGGSIRRPHRIFGP